METQLAVTIAASAALSNAVDMREYVGDAGLIYIPAWTAASLGFYVSDAYAGTYAPLRDDAGAVVEISGIQTAAAAWYKIPEELRGAAWVKLWSETAGSDVNQAAARACMIFVKG